jgi:hypothetical protein
LHSSHGDIFQ